MKIMIRKKWNEEEIELLKSFVDYGLSNLEISIKLNRTKISIDNKLRVLGYKRNFGSTYKNKLPKDITLLEDYINATTKILHKHTCGYEWKVRPNNILNGQNCPKCRYIEVGNKLRKSVEDYISELPIDITLLSNTYLNAHTKLTHKHSCGYIWEITPHDILKGRSCPKCADYGFDPTIQSQVYLIYFESINLYKIGLSNNYAKRIKQFSIPCEIILIQKFEKGSDASKLEKEWLQNVRPYMKNTGLLRSGNTETFEYF